MRFVSVVLALLISSSALAAKKDQGFRYSYEDFACQNEAGESGMNPGFIGECGDMTKRKLDNVAQKAFVSWKFSQPGHTLTGSSWNGMRLGFQEISGLGIELGIGRFHDVSLRFADFRDADLQDLELLGYDFRGADFRGANLSRIQMLSEGLWAGAVFDRGTHLPFSRAGAFARDLVALDEFERDGVKIQQAEGVWIRRITCSPHVFGNGELVYEIWDGIERNYGGIRTYGRQVKVSMDPFLCLLYSLDPEIKSSKVGVRTEGQWLYEVYYLN